MFYKSIWKVDALIGKQASLVKTLLRRGHSSGQITQKVFNPPATREPHTKTRTQGPPTSPAVN